MIFHHHHRHHQHITWLFPLPSSLEVFSLMNKLLLSIDKNNNNSNNRHSQNCAFNINIMIFWCFMILIGTRPMYIIFTCFCSTLAPSLNRCINLLICLSHSSGPVLPSKSSSFSHITFLFISTALFYCQSTRIICSGFVVNQVAVLTTQISWNNRKKQQQQQRRMQNIN